MTKITTFLCTHLNEYIKKFGLCFHAQKDAYFLKQKLCWLLSDPDSSYQYFNYTLKNQNITDCIPPILIGLIRPQHHTD